MKEKEEYEGIIIPKFIKLTPENVKSFSDFIFKIRETERKKTIEEIRGFESYFLIKPDIEMQDICYNAHSKNCIKCQDECELSGINKEKLKEDGKK